MAESLRLSRTACAPHQVLTLKQQCLPSTSGQFRHWPRMRLSRSTQHSHILIFALHPQYARHATQESLKGEMTQFWNLAHRWEVKISKNAPKGYNQAPTDPKKNMRCCSMLQAIGGGYPKFPKATKMANPSTTHKGMHLPTPCKGEHNKIYFMGSLDAFSYCPLQTVCSTPGCLLVPLGLCCPLLSGFNSRQNEENHDLPKHNTARKKGNFRLDCVPLSQPALLQIANPRN